MYINYTNTGSCCCTAATCMALTALFWAVYEHENEIIILCFLNINKSSIFWKSNAYTYYISILFICFVSVEMLQF